MSEYEDRCGSMPNIVLFDDYESALTDFEQKSMRTRKQVMDRIMSYVKKIDSNEMFSDMNPSSRRIISASLKRLLRGITYKMFPDLTNQKEKWTYSLYIFEGKIQIRYQIIGFSSVLNQWMIEQSDLFFECETVLYSVSEYAKRNEVADTTVREWIRRGKLDTAVKKGLEWFIPALSKPLDRTAKIISFERITYDDDISDFPIIDQDARFIVINKAKEKGNFKITFFDDNLAYFGEKIMEKNEMMKVRRRLLESYDFEPSASSLIYADNY